MEMNTDSYLSPGWILKMFDGWFDPCPLNDNPIEDGLKIEFKIWTVILNPFKSHSMERLSSPHDSEE